jgi:exosortase
MFVLGSLYRAGAGTSQPGTLAITMGAMAILLSLLWINSPDSAKATSGRPDSTTPARGGILDDVRVRLVSLFVFPIGVWLVSAPMVSAIETQLSLFLLRKVVTVVAFVYVEVLGLPIEQQGNVLAMPGGTVGVAEACSGIRSLMASLFAGSFLAAVYLERFWQKVAVVACSLAMVFLANIARSLGLTALAYYKGPRAIEGAAHDIAGYAVLGLTFAGLVGLVWLFNGRRTPVPAAA